VQPKFAKRHPVAGGRSGLSISNQYGGGRLGCLNLAAAWLESCPGQSRRTAEKGSARLYQRGDSCIRIHIGGSSGWKAGPAQIPCAAALAQ